ncbi:MAG: magnesium chelatase subunit D family protein [Clostridium sp.]|uniref:magnesium chelatase subunit D family protein n=1 Tax=Clostridium sp. TaxID=1506 RepID=UPI00302054F3
MSKNYVYPFVAIVGQEKVKKSLILNIVNPAIGGVLISGEKGTAKSTLVRGLSQMIKDVKVVNLPLNITEDRLVGTIDIERAIALGRKVFEPGILKDANENILYVDEVNLLSEHIINSLLSVSASGNNHVEREGISYNHPSRFILIGTMNPEEGSLRSQFLDRFGLYIEVEGSKSIVERKEIVKRRLQYENNPIKFIKLWESQSAQLLNKILAGKEFLKNVQVSPNIMKLASEISEERNCAGHRAEIAIIETAKTIAALEKRNVITISDIKEAAELALPHRIREKTESKLKEDNEISNQDENNQNENNQDQNNQDENNENEDMENMKDMPDDSSTDNNVDDNDLDGKNNNENLDEDVEDKNREQEDNTNESESDDKNTEKDNMDESMEDIDDIGRTFIVKSLNISSMDKRNHKGDGKRSKTRTDSAQGRYVRYSIPKDKIRDIAFDATLRMAAPYQKSRDKNGLAIAIKKEDIREKQREKRTGATILFVVDASGSMGAKKRMASVKGAIVSLLTDAYQKRDKVGMIAFRKKEAQVLLGITRSVDLAEKCLKDLPTGGQTPISEGINLGYEILKARKKKDPEMIPVMVLISDGRANSSANGGDPYEESINIATKVANEKIQTIVIDTEQDFIKLGLARKIADAMNAKYYKIKDLESDKILDVVRNDI